MPPLGSGDQLGGPLAVVIARWCESARVARDRSGVIHGEHHLRRDRRRKADHAAGLLAMSSAVAGVAQGHEVRGLERELRCPRHGDAVVNLIRQVQAAGLADRVLPTVIPARRLPASRVSDPLPGLQRLDAGELHSTGLQAFDHAGLRGESAHRWAQCGRSTPDIGAGTRVVGAWARGRRIESRLRSHARIESPAITPIGPLESGPRCEREPSVRAHANTRSGRRAGGRRRVRWILRCPPRESRYLPGF
jgi:hypothetical protein